MPAGSRPRVVVTGLGAVAPNGIGLDAFRSALSEGRSGIRRQESLKELNFRCQIGGVPPLSEEDVLRVLPFDACQKLSEAMVYASLAAVECARSSGATIDLKGPYWETPVDWETGAVIGCGMGSSMEFLIDEYFPALCAARTAEPGRGALALGAEAVPKVMGSSVSVTIGRLLGLGSQVTTNSSACATGVESIFEGFKHIVLGHARSMYVGAAEGTHYGLWAGFDAMRDVLCSAYNEMPERGSQPMGAGACGFVPGGGAGVLRLEALDSALRRGAPILCELAAAFCNSGGQRDGGSMTFPNPEGVVRCIQATLEQARARPKDVSLINAHLTSTLADPLEVSNWRKALGLAPDEFPLIQSTKSMIGHCLGAAGALEAVAAVDQLARGYVHPSINCEEVHPEILPVAGSIPRRRLDRELRCVVKAAFGFGDVNGCLLFKRYYGGEHDGI